MIEWISINDELPPIGCNVLTLTMPRIEDGKVIKLAGIAHIREDSISRDDYSEFFTHWAWITAPRAPNGHKQMLLDIEENNRLAKKAEEEEELKRWEARVAEMKTPEYQQALKDAFDYQDELDRKAAQRRAAKDPKQ